MKVRRPYAFCCIEGGGRPEGCSCIKPQHGHAIVEVRGPLPGDEIVADDAPSDQDASQAQGEVERLSVAMLTARATFERIRVMLINELDEPVRRAFWAAVAGRDALDNAMPILSPATTPTPTIPADMVAVIERLEALMAKATKRPWRVFDGGAGLLAIMKGNRPSVHSTAANKRWPEIVKWAGFDGTDVGRRYDNANAELMVEAVNALPELLNALRSLAAALKQAEQQGVEE